jgi:hypothetical protein
LTRIHTTMSQKTYNLASRVKARFFFVLRHS